MGWRPLAPLFIAGSLGVLGLASPGQAAQFACAAADSTCLVAAIRTANRLAEPSTIRLAPGIYALTAVDNDTAGPNGLPSVTGTLTRSPRTSPGIAGGR